MKSPQNESELRFESMDIDEDNDEHIQRQNEEDILARADLISVLRGVNDGETTEADTIHCALHRQEFYDKSLDQIYTLPGIVTHCKNINAEVTLIVYKYILVATTIKVKSGWNELVFRAQDTLNHIHGSL